MPPSASRAVAERGVAPIARSSALELLENRCASQPPLVVDPVGLALISTSRCCLRHAFTSSQFADFGGASRSTSCIKHAGELYSRIVTHSNIFKPLEIRLLIGHAVRALGLPQRLPQRLEHRVLGGVRITELRRQLAMNLGDASRPVRRHLLPNREMHPHVQERVLARHAPA